MSQIEWAEPPAPFNARGKYDVVAQELRANPGRWARIKQGVKGTAQPFRDGRVTSFRPVGDFEFRQVSVEDARFDIYARFVGGESS